MLAFVTSRRIELFDPDARLRMDGSVRTCLESIECRAAGTGECRQPADAFGNASLLRADGIGNARGCYFPGLHRSSRLRDGKRQQADGTHRPAADFQASLALH